jgi:adenylate cyclase
LVFVVRHHRDVVEVASLQLGEEVWRIHFGLLVRPNLLPAGEQLLRMKVVADRVPHRMFKRFGETALPKRVGRLSDDWRKRIKRWSIRHFIPGAVWFNSFVLSENSEQRKLAAIMFTDMVGYSALSQRDDKLALELLEEHRQLLREIFPRFNGTEIKTIGDAFLIEFHSALEAAQCATEIQRTLANRNHDVTADRRIELKIGIHIGDVVHRGGDVYGDGVNIASRIEALAGAGGICVSMDVERQIRNALEARFEKLAPTELKNISVPMDLFRIVLPWEKKSEGRGQKSEIRKPDLVPASRRFALIGGLVLLVLLGIGWWWTTLPRRTVTPRQNASAARTEKARAIPDKSIAVLPFENLSSEKENAYFADGVQDEILTNLAKIAEPKVISRTSVSQYKTGVARNLRKIGEEPAVAHVVEGSVQRAGNKVRVNAQLIDARNDAHLAISGRNYSEAENILNLVAQQNLPDDPVTPRI